MMTIHKYIIHFLDFLTHVGHSGVGLFCGRADFGKEVMLRKTRDYGFTLKL